MLSACNPTTQSKTDGDQHDGIGQSALSAQQQFAIAAGDCVYFDTDHWDLSTTAQEVLHRQASWPRQHPSQLVTIAGYADERGTRDHNLALGERRANSAAD